METSADGTWWYSGCDVGGVWIVGHIWTELVFRFWDISEPLVHVFVFAA